MSFCDVTGHYERHPYPHYPLLASIKRHDTYAMNLTALWGRFNGEILPERRGRILLSGCGAFAPYPMSLSNPKAEITGVDLARNNLRRARLHCLLHARFNVKLLQGDFLDPTVTPGPYHFIEAFGVLHHLDDPAAGMRSLEQRLLPGGILRVMVYGHYARQEAESVRRALRLLKVRDVPTIKRMIKRSEPESRLRSYIDSSWEARTDSGLADLFLHPNVKSYRIEEFMELVADSGLKPLLFTHRDAVADPAEEIQRLRGLDHLRETRANIICYLGRDCNGSAPVSPHSRLLLNPALREAVSPFTLGSPRPIDRLGHENQRLDRQTRRFLRRFVTPLPEAALTAAERALAERFVTELFLVRLRGD
ncbi:MAG TPA: methyltransferase domain-containing protein [Desulfuromonadales bacterium]|nr:methyltransferase domain-containing protein [Desulfuromonadales bacterium]